MLSKMALLCKTPEDYSGEILSQWCKVKDIAVLEAAVCNKKQRQELLKIFQSSGFILNNIHGFQSLDYINTYNIKVKSIVLSCGPLTRPVNVNNIDPTKISSLSFSWERTAQQQDNLTNLIALIDSCTNLKSLDLSCFGLEPSFMFKISSKIWSGLEEFTTKFNCIDEGGINHMAHHCSALTLLVIDRNKSYVKESHLINLVECKVNLQTLVITSRDTLRLTSLFLQYVAIYCKQLVYLDLYMSSDLNMKTVNEVIQNCPQLKMIQLSNEQSQLYVVADNDIDSRLVTNNKIWLHEGATSATESDLIEFFDSHLAKPCVTLEIRNVDSFYGSVLSVVVANCPSLQRFSGANCPIETADVIALIDNCTHLTNISLESCYLVEESEVHSHNVIKSKHIEFTCHD